jgi:hypothetical protein
MRAGRRVGAALLAALALSTGGAAGQSLAARVQQVRDGTVRFHFDTRPGVEICDQGIRMGPHNRLQWSSRSWDDDEGTNCRSGFAEVELAIRGGRVHDVSVVKRLVDRTASARDLGAVGAEEAAHYLLGVARAAGERTTAEHAMLPAVLAAAPDAWRDLLDMARDRGVDEGVRKSALFWVSQEAGEVITRGLEDVAGDGDESQGIRDAAVFALSQRPAAESVPALMEVARTAPQVKTRKAALFWLAQSDDPRVPSFFEKILLGGQGG